MYRLQSVQLTASAMQLESPAPPDALLSRPVDLVTFQPAAAVSSVSVWPRTSAPAAAAVHAYIDTSACPIQKHHQQQPLLRQQQDQWQPKKHTSKRGVAEWLKSLSCSGLSCLPDRESTLDSTGSINSRYSFLPTQPPNQHANTRCSSTPSCVAGLSMKLSADHDAWHLPEHSSSSSLTADLQAPGNICHWQHGQHCNVQQHVPQSESWQQVRSSMSWHTSITDWHDACSQFTSCGVDEDHAAVDEYESLVQELGSPKVHWVPDPPLAFGTHGMQFVPVPAVTGFAGCWERDDSRTTPFPQPIDLMLKASYIAQKVHESIPGILIEETATELSIIAQPRYMPKFLGIKCYQERFDKVRNSEHSWVPRRDLKMGRVYGKLYMTANGTLIARLWTRPAFSSAVDIIVEEYMSLEQDGQVIVDRMTCLHVDSGKRASQYQVGIRRPGPCL